MKCFDLMWKKPAVESVNGLLIQIQQCSISSPRTLPLIHARIIKSHCLQDGFLLTRLAHAYLTSDTPAPAKRIFTHFPKKPPLFLWNEMIKWYSRNRCFRESIDLYYLMASMGVRRNEFTFTFVLPACAGARSVLDGRIVHVDLVKIGYERNVFVATALVDMYCKCGEIGLARKVFDDVSSKGTAIFNAMVSGYVNNNEHGMAMAVFDSMQNSGVVSDAITMVSILQSCASLGALRRGRMIHDQIQRSSHLDINVYIGAALINMYARCGSIEDSRKVFDEMPDRDLISWTTLISGYGMHGLAKNAESLFTQMINSGIKPDAVAFVGILSSFSHCGMVDIGQNYFHRMTKEYRIEPTLEHYSCMVDMFGRAGKLDEAEEVIRTMGVAPDSGILGSLLNSCKLHLNVQVAERITEHILSIDPENAGWYVLMSNIYATAKNWNGVTKMRVLMKEKNLIKPPGWSSIEINGEIHSFLVFDQRHPDSTAIYDVMRNLESRIRVEGYVPDTSCVLRNVGEDLKLDMLCGHSERLAIAFGILRTGEGEVLRIMKNLRVCLDCHTATKFISRITGREIILRDSKRFHHFKDGSCSCGDYW